MTIATIIAKIIVTILVVAFVFAAGVVGLLIWAADEVHQRLAREPEDRWAL